MDENVIKLRYQQQVNYKMAQLANRGAWMVRNIVKMLWFLAKESCMPGQTPEERLAEMFKIVVKKDEEKWLQS